MKIALTTSGDDLNAPLDSRFGRTPRFIVVDSENLNYTLVENEQNLNSAQGAGIQSALTITNAGASVVITGHCGPKAFKVLQTAGIKIYNTNVRTVNEALTMFKEGKLIEAQNADVEGHWI